MLILSSCRADADVGTRHALAKVPWGASGHPSPDLGPAHSWAGLMIPLPRTHRERYHGLLAPHATLRPAVTAYAG